MSSPTFSPDNPPPPSSISESSVFEVLPPLSNKGRQVKDPTKAADMENAPEVVARTVPDIQNRTRVIAVCGVADYDVDIVVQNFEEGGVDEDVQTGAADPRHEGWFLSDFFAFKHILDGAGSSQKWIMAEDPAYLAQKYTQYLHGSPFYDRKVVLNAEMVDSNFKKNILVCAPSTLKETFESHLKEESDAARKAKQPLLVMMFGHGHKSTHGISLGGPEHDRLFHMDNFKDAIGDGLDVTLVTTACYSGGWTINKTLNTTTLVAAGPRKQSVTWAVSDSLSRFCGSIFATSLLESWRKESSEAAGTANISEHPEQQHSYAAFTSLVYDRLFEIDRFAGRHDIHFSAQHDDWASAWGDRTGIPLENLQKKWDALPSIPTTQNPQSWANVHSSVGSQRRASSISLRERFGSVTATVRRVQLAATIYLDSHPGRDNLASNTTLHGSLRRLIGGRVKFSIQTVLNLYDQICHRTYLMNLATCLLLFTGIPLPEGLICANFDAEKFEDLCDKHRNDLRAKKYRYSWDRINTNILPEPDVKIEGLAWHKPHQFISAAIALDQKIKSPTDVEAAVRKLEQACQEDIVLPLKKNFERNADIRDRKNKWSSFRERLRSLSPRKKGKRSSEGGVTTPPLPESSSDKGKGKGKRKM